MNSNSPHNSPVFYLDRNLGRRIIPAILSAAQISYEIHDDHLPADAPDEDWIRLCGKQGWIAVTHDAKLKSNLPALEAIRDSVGRVFIVSGANHTGQQVGEMLVEHYQILVKRSEQWMPPFLATLMEDGHVRRHKL